MIMKSKKALITYSFIAALVMVLIVALISPSINSANYNGVAQSFNDGWYIQKDDGTRELFTSFGETLEQNKITLVHAHDDKLNSIDVLGLYNYYSAINVYVGDNLIYSYGSIEDLNNHVNLGNYYSMVDIHRHEMRESDISVVYMNNNPQTIYGFTGGSGGSLEMALVREYIVTLLTPLVSLIFLIVTIFLSIRKTTKNFITPSHLWLLAFSLLLSIWELADSQILMDIGFKAGRVCLVSFEVFMLLPIPLLMFTNCSCKKYYALNRFMCVSVFINFIVLNILNFTHIKDFLYSLNSTHVIVLASIVVCFIQILSEYYSKPSINTVIFVGGYIVFMLFAGVQYLDFFINPTGSNTKYLQIGILIYLLLQLGLMGYTIYQKTNFIVNRLQDQTLYLETAFKSFVPDNIIQQRLKKRENIAKAGTMKYLTVLESDIRGFSEFIQDMTPDAAIDMLNHYFECMTNIISRQGGFCLEYVGDAIIALFEEERIGIKHADKALIAAIQMQYIMKDINEWNEKRGYPTFETGIGIHSGSVYVGYIGSVTRMEYDAIGSTMNLVSRIQNYSTGGQILISSECKKNITLNMKIEKSFTIYPKGFKGGTEVFWIVGLGDPYNISSGVNEETTRTLQENIYVTYNMIVDKKIEDSTYEGYISEVSHTNAMLVTQHSLELYDNLKFNYKDGFTCKVISKSERGVLLRFTSTLPDFATHIKENGR